jgi:tetratricopeptide (TPR) repeat protein
MTPVPPRPRVECPILGVENGMRISAVLGIALLWLAAGSMAAERPFEPCSLPYGSDATLEQCTKLIDGGTLQGGKLAKAFMVRGRNHHERKAYDLAIADFDAALRASPEDASAFYYRAQALLELNHPDRALADLGEAIRLGRGRLPDYFLSKMLVERGNMSRDSGSLDPAIADYNEAIDLTPTSIWALDHRATAYEKKGDTQGALSSLSLEDQRMAA